MLCTESSIEEICPAAVQLGLRTKLLRGKQGARSELEVAGSSFDRIAFHTRR